jgi:hypothetical protein
MTIPVINSTQPDILRWPPAPSGKCTTTEAYSYLAHLQQHTLPSQGARSISSQANQILQKVWKAKSIPPFLKTFVWRLIRRALATADRAGGFPLILIRLATIVVLLKLIITFCSYVTCLCKSGLPTPILSLFTFFTHKRMVFKCLCLCSLLIILLKTIKVIFSLLFGICGELEMIIVSEGKIGVLCKYKRWLKAIG